MMGGQKRVAAHSFEKYSTRAGCVFPAILHAMSPAAPAWADKAIGGRAPREPPVLRERT